MKKTVKKKTTKKTKTKRSKTVLTKAQSLLVQQAIAEAMQRDHRGYKSA